MTTQTLSPTSFNNQVQHLSPGSRIVYHVGSLVNDRCAHNGEHLRAHSVGTAAWDAMMAGKVDLFQRTIMPDVHEYMAIKRAEPHNRVLWVNSYRKLEEERR